MLKKKDIKEEGMKWKEPKITSGNEKQSLKIVNRIKHKIKKLESRSEKTVEIQRRDKL